MPAVAWLFSFGDQGGPVMSLHVSPSYSGFASRLPAGEVIAPGLLEGIASHFGREETGPVEDRLSIRLDTLGMVIALSRPSEGAPPAARVALGAKVAGEGGIRLEADHPGMAHGSSLQHSASEDPVVRSCSQALEQLKGRADESAGIYADALRLAIVTRLLGLRTHPAAELPSAEPAGEPVRSGLPKWRLKRVMAYVDANIGEAITLAGMAAAAGLSRMHFAAQFRIATGIRPHEYVMRRRIERAQAMLLETRTSLVEIALSVGFQTQAHFTTVFRRFVGDTPNQWRCANCRNGQG